MSSPLVAPAASSKARPPSYQIGDRHAFITVMSYNIQGLPRIAGIKQDRYIDIGSSLGELRATNRNPAIVFLQEAFVKRTEEIHKPSGYKHFETGPGPRSPDRRGNRVFKILNSGLVAMSDHAITKSAKIAFDDRICRSWDCLAAKGAQAVRIKIEGIPFEIPFINTHAQAGAEYDSCRVSQFKILWDFAKKFIASDSEPFIAVGDFNTFIGRPSYDFWLDSTGLKSVNELFLKEEMASRCAFSPRKGRGFNESPDHQFYRGGVIDGYNVSIEPVYAEHLFFEPYGGRLLSDHWAYNVTYEIKW